MIAGAACAPRQRPMTGKLDRIGVQLYTLRKMMEQSVPDTLAAVAKAGYNEVEFAGYFNHSTSEIKKLIDANGLVSPSAHIQLADIGQNWEIFLEDANIIGQQYLTVAWIDQPDRTADGYKRIAEQFNKAGTKARTWGVHLAYHTYSYEWVPVDGKRTGMEILLDECEPKNLAVEADVFWMRKAGQDVVDWINRYPGRFHMLHAKDMGPAPKNEMLDVGKGVIDWRAILGMKEKAGIRHVFVEHDEPPDPIASITASYQYLKALRFAA